MEVQYVESEKGHRKLLLNNHKHVKDEEVDSNIYWRCEMYKRFKCSVRIISLNNDVVRATVYALLPDKTQSTFTRLLTAIKNIEPIVSPISILMDFELAMMNGVRDAFPESIIKGCFFQFSQSVFRHIQTEGLQRRYEMEPEFALTMRMLPALAFVPAGNVINVFEQLCEENVIPPEAQGVLDYFEDTWIGRPLRRQRRPPRFPYNMWNCFDGVNEDLPKTNNSVEGWHRSFDQQISSTHPNIWKYIEALQREQSLHRLQIEQYISGEEPPRSHRKYRDCAARIKRLVQQFNVEGNTNDYLRGIAHNLNL
ncbi:hypothetical protein FQR65_LT14564 [Abscondita terminalis]|nr:hypothetical protein FQR65_LT14564 [Abscondita terminalis]